MKTVIAVAAALLIISLATGSEAVETVPAASAVSTQATAVSPAHDGLVLTLQLSDDGLIPEELSGTVIAYNSNAVGIQPIRVKSIVVKPYGRLGGVYAPQRLLNTELSLASQEKRIFSVKFMLARSPTVFDHVTFRSGPNEFIATATYYVLEQVESRTADFSLIQNVATSKVYVVSGGLCGAVLLIGFLIASKFLALVKAGQFQSIFPRWKELCFKWFFMIVAYAINGVFVALLLVLLSAGLGTFDMPVAFKLQDFGGGLMVGLFSITLGKFVAEKLAVLAP